MSSLTMNICKIDLLFFDKMAGAVKEVSFNQIIYFRNITKYISPGGFMFHDSYIKCVPSKNYMSCHSSHESYTGFEPKEQNFGDNGIIFDIDSISDVVILLSPATLNRLTKLYSYDYLSIGHYQMNAIYQSGETYTSMHRIPNHLNGKNLSILPNVDIEYICGIGISLTSAIMQISDITIISVD